MTSTNRHLSDAAPEQYSAFLSYSHDDTTVVRKIHSRIESFRIPKGLVSPHTQRQHARRVGKIFRDREDLAAGPDLSAAVKNALDNSRALIVACSPAARRSHWVEREIAYFQERHPRRLILALILSGEPEAVIPPALTAYGQEPLAADFRKGRDGWSLGILKTVSGIMELPLDALAQRESQRKLRRVTAVTGLTSAVAIAMIFVTSMALQARNEAQALRRNSDTLIGELLIDGRNDLKEVGRLDVLEGFNDRALRFYERQGDPSNLPADSLQNWALILHAMGEDETKKTDQDLDYALEIFTAAHSATGELLERSPRDPDRIFGHAQSEYWIGRIDELQGRLSSAQSHYDAYNELTVALELAQPGSHRSKIERGYGELNLGILHFKNGEFSDAEVRFDEAVSWLEKADKLLPEDRATMSALANALAWSFDSHFKQGHFEIALAKRQEGAAITRRLVDSGPADMEARFTLIVAERAIALTRMKIDSDANEKPKIEELVGAIGELRAFDPYNQEWAAFEAKLKEDLVQLEGDNWND